jgi:hypothetical protein
MIAKMNLLGIGNGEITANAIYLSFTDCEERLWEAYALLKSSRIVAL